LVSLYVFDGNSLRAAADFRGAPFPFVLTPLLETEMVNAFYLRVFRKESTEKQIRDSLDLFAKDVRARVFEARSLSSEVFRQAAEISARRTARFGTRTLDLLHVASAVVLRAEEFYTFDQRQAQLAKAEGFKVVGLN
jgi:predicted nucleic acid-binding protein